ncbi:hypothetical protein DPMN_191322, partial [Dreissena polymorpha]
VRKTRSLGAGAGPVTTFWCGPRTGHYILVWASDLSVHSGVSLGPVTTFLCGLRPVTTFWWGLGPVTTFWCGPRTGYYILV